MVSEEAKAARATGAALERVKAALAGTEEVAEGARPVRAGMGMVPERGEVTRVGAEASEGGAGVVGAEVDEEVGHR